MTIPLQSPATLTATYKIITPMFIGDAEQRATWISPMSFKGALRFWWRALVWGRIRAESPNDEAALEQLHREEALLFGDTDNGRGLMAVKITQPKVKIITDFPPSNPNSASAYLAYGLTGDKKNPHREAIHEDVDFSVTLILDAKITDTQSAEVTQTLTALGLFGGLGSRARRANGAIQLTAINGEGFRINDKADYQQKAQIILQDSQQTTLAPYTAFSKDSLFSVSDSIARDARMAHGNLGADYKTYRGQPSNLRGEKKKVFGLPLKGADETARRASPLFFHIVEFSSGQFGYSVLYLPTSIFHKDTRHQNVDYGLTKGFTQAVGG